MSFNSPSPCTSSRRTPPLSAKFLFSIGKRRSMFIHQKREVLAPGSDEEEGGNDSILDKTVPEEIQAHCQSPVKKLNFTNESDESNSGSSSFTQIQQTDVNSTFHEDLVDKMKELKFNMTTALSPVEKKSLQSISTKDDQISNPEHNSVTKDVSNVVITLSDQEEEKQTSSDSIVIISPENFTKAMAEKSVLLPNISEFNALQQEEEQDSDSSIKETRPKCLIISDDEEVTEDPKYSRGSNQGKVDKAVSCSLSSDEEIETGNEIKDDDSPSFIVKRKTKRRHRILSDSSSDDSEKENEGESSYDHGNKISDYQKMSDDTYDDSFVVSDEDSDFLAEEKEILSDDDNSGSAKEDTDDEDKEEEESFKEPEPESPKVPLKTPASTKKRSQKEEASKTLSLMSSLSLEVVRPDCHPSAKKYISSFNRHKKELAANLFRLFNEEIFFNSLDPNTLIEWRPKLTRAGGFCRCMIRHQGNQEVERFVSIALSSKVVDRPARLRDVLIHEMCHAATWVVSGVNDGHGCIWKDWARRAMISFPDLAVIERCHQYEIHAKFSYVCQSCKMEYKRHSKSVDTDRYLCGRCKGNLKLVQNKILKTPHKLAVQKVEPKKSLNPFANFVKENYKHVRKEGMAHKEAMKLLSQKFAKMKTNQPGDDEGKENVPVKESAS